MPLEPLRAICTLPVEGLGESAKVKVEFIKRLKKYQKTLQWRWALIIFCF